MTGMTPASPTPAAKPKPRPRPQVMKLTEAAAQRITELTKRADSEIVGLRVGIKNGGCAGQSYTVEYAHEVRPAGEVVEDRGVKILVDPKAVLFLLGTEMDYKADKMQAQFIFNNPNQVSACGCGESVQLTPAKVLSSPACTDLILRSAPRASRRMAAGEIGASWFETPQAAPHHEGL